MAIIATFDGSNLGIDAYEKVLASDPERIADQPERLHHVCYRVGSGFKVVDVWTSREALDAAAQSVIVPAMVATGMDPLVPEVHEVHNIMPGGGRAAANAATVMAIYEAFGRGDVAFILDQMDDDVVWEEGGRDQGVPWLVPGRGRDHVVRFFGVVGESLAFERFEPGPPMASDTQVAVPLRITTRVVATGKVIEEDPEVHLWTFGPDGKVASFRHFVDVAAHQAALQA